jgi:hypothetical protein
LIFFEEYSTLPPSAISYKAFSQLNIHRYHLVAQVPLDPSAISYKAFSQLNILHYNLVAQVPLEIWVTSKCLVPIILQKKPSTYFYHQNAAFN